MLKHPKLVPCLKKTSQMYYFLLKLSFVFKNPYYIIYYFKWENSHQWNTTLNFYQSRGFPCEAKFCSESKLYNCLNPQISVQWNFNSLLHFVQEQNYQWWKWSPKRKQCADSSINPFISQSPAVFWVLSSLALFYFKCWSSYFMDSFSLPDWRWLKFQRIHWSISFSWLQHVFSLGLLYENYVYNQSTKNGLIDRYIHKTFWIS